ncbi:MAG: hypothetical protein RMM53_04835 [Bacteroidia bacterium]|nr:hypothetical protein [Bacteroidia bacterium]MDW8333524.1 hypothetical protein [Bacteroidia bacterium]
MEVLVERRLQELKETGYRISIKDYFNGAIEIFKAEAGPFILFSLLYLAVQGLLNFVLENFGLLISIVLSPPLSAGYIFAAHKIRNGEPLYFSDFFQGFKLITPLVVSSLIGGAISLLGFIFLIIPGVYFTVAYYMAPFFVVFYGMSGWDALEASRKLVHRQWFDVFVFLLAILLIDLLGVICLGVGLLVAVPITSIMLYLFFEDVFGLNIKSEDLIDSLGR